MSTSIKHCLELKGNITSRPGVVSPTELRRNMEHAELREQLKKCTAQLVSVEDAEMPEMIREVRHGLEVLLQRQQKAMKDIEARYSPRKWAVATGGVAVAVAAASMYVMPSLAVVAGVSAPIATTIAGFAGGGLGMVKEWTGKSSKRRKPENQCEAF